ncbi:MAG: hypothetical protein COV67_04390 [Nitrospinae bacterium CG11_big_fil_rev_8_21_14_0_20_56_8]|nr:MAG: hypothetical protein COV67_04390 [Nitrospinae bacterium CG11_big_fil_rev_8_21_14_0_20_56_8]
MISRVAVQRSGFVDQPPDLRSVLRSGFQEFESVQRVLPLLFFSKKREWRVCRTHSRLLFEQDNMVEVGIQKF